MASTLEVPSNTATHSPHSSHTPTQKHPTHSSPKNASSSNSSDKRRQPRRGTKTQPPADSSPTSRPRSSKPRNQRPISSPGSQRKTEDPYAPTQFICIESAIEPLRSVVEEGGTGKTVVVNGNDVFVGWVERSLKQFEEVVLVGVDQGIAVVVSIVTMLQIADIAYHHEVETFTTEETKGSYKSCIQFRLHRGSALENELAQTRKLSLISSASTSSTPPGKKEVISHKHLLPVPTPTWVRSEGR
ncbi:uncharacterized protein VTP21DRAFT_9846 [Calcarisporiella thermophila]|uniref:uncharacterized protein n=1 Tax=Calcarisporiella thermophila TaxID=911321 RepID=UPI003744AA22